MYLYIHQNGWKHVKFKLRIYSKKLKILQNEWKRKKRKFAKKVKICLNRDLANTDFFAINQYFDENQIMSEKCLNQEMAIFHWFHRDPPSQARMAVLNIYIYIYEQPSKLAETKICIGWTLVFRKCKKLRLAMGPFQIAIPHVELNS